MRQDPIRKIVQTAVCAAALSLTGCADNNESLIILGSPTWPERELPSGDIAADCGVGTSVDTTIPIGLLDVGFATPYQLGIVIENQLVQRTATTGIDQSEVQLVDADVRLSMDQAPEIIEELEANNEALVDFTLPLAGDSLPGGGQKGLLIKAIPSATAEALRPLILENFSTRARPVITATVVINARGTASGGALDDISSREYPFPIELCDKCLVDCSPCGGACPTGLNTEPGGDFVAGHWVGGVCGHAQDWFPLYPSSCIESSEG